MRACPPVVYLVLLSVDELADGSDEATQAFEALLIKRLEQLKNALVHELLLQ